MFTHRNNASMIIDKENLWVEVVVRWGKYTFSEGEASWNKTKKGVVTKRGLGKEFPLLVQSDFIFLTSSAPSHLVSRQIPCESIVQYLQRKKKPLFSFIPSRNEKRKYLLTTTNFDAGNQTNQSVRWCAWWRGYLVGVYNCALYRY